QRAGGQLPGGSLAGDLPQTLPRYHAAVGYAAVEAFDLQRPARAALAADGYGCGSAGDVHLGMIAPPGELQLEVPFVGWADFDAGPEVDPVDDNSDRRGCEHLASLKPYCIYQPAVGISRNGGLNRPLWALDGRLCVRSCVGTHD